MDFEDEGGPSEASNVSDADAPRFIVFSTSFASASRVKRASLQ